MSLYLEVRTTPFHGESKAIKDVIDRLSGEGFIPLITKAKISFVSIFGLSMPKESDISADMRFEYVYRRRLVRYRDDTRVPLIGDLFFTPDQKGIIYLALMIPESSVPRRTRDADTTVQLEIGLIGNSTGIQHLEALLKSTTRMLKEMGIKPIWNTSVSTNQQFQNLYHNKENRFVVARSLLEDELKIAEIFVDQATRDIALTIKRSGVILANELKKLGGKTTKGEQMIHQLLQSGLIAQEYVVICKKTSNQVNRVDSMEKIEQMTSIGVMCSCGNPIANERIEELFIPTQKLQMMLDQSYWMTVHLVRLFRSIEIPEDKILINLQEGAEEIDLFVDLDGSLVMFELKDSVFSMGHAYPFGGRIGLYKPEIAVIVSTKGVAPEVKEYFSRVKPGAKLVYIGNLKELESNLKELIDQTRSKKAIEILSQFEALAIIEAPIRQMTESVLGLKITKNEE